MKLTSVVTVLSLGASVSAELTWKFPWGSGWSFPGFGAAPSSFPGPSSSSTTTSVVTKSTTTSGLTSKFTSSTISTSVAGPTYTVPGAPASYGYFTRPNNPPMGPSRPTQSVGPWGSTSGDAGTWPFMPNGPQHRGNWIPGFDINTDYNTKWPTTGRTVKYALTISNTTLAPDGIPKQMLVINGQYPGPKIEANWGDYLEITVTNKLTNNGTGLHWHGLRQLGSNLADGANGVTECPIAPGDTKVYRFQATQYGTSWYHSHFSVQYGDGVIGPLQINGPASANYDIDLGTVLLTESYDQTVFQEDFYAHRHGPPTAKNYLMNGQNVRNDGTVGKRSQWTFTPGLKHRIRLVNTAMDALFKVQIDGHKFQVIQTDFVPIIPYNTSELSIAIGQRYDIIVQADQAPSNYWFRAMSAKDCTFTENDGTGIANGIISYANAKSPTALPTTTYGNHSNACIDEPMASLVPVVSKSVDSGSFQAVASALPVNIQVVSSTEGILFQWTLGGISQVIDWGNPTMANAVIGNNTYSADKHVISLDKKNVWTYWIIQNQFFVPHPFHLHGHDFSLLGQGSGTFDASTDMSKLNFANPPRRDVAMLVASGWSVIAFETDNPGAWLMHCHIAWHAGEGLSLQFLERPADIPAKYAAEVEGTQFQKTCTNWNKYAPSAVWKQYDSGLKKRTLDDGMEVVELAELPPRAGIGRRHSHAHGHGHVRRSMRFRR